MNTRQLIFPTIVAAIVALLLVPVQVMPERALLVGERLFAGGGWVQIVMASGYSFLLARYMMPRESRSVWRNRSWMLFTLFFYGQLALGIFGDSLFLMTGKLHLPIPAVIVAGPVYRFSSWFMPILFFSAILLAGPAWCSHLCYFGALDSAAARVGAKRKRAGQGSKRRVFRDWMWRWKPILRVGVLMAVVAMALVLRLMRGIGNGVISLFQDTAALWAILFFAIGLLIILLISMRRGIMAHCTVWCPVGTVVNYMKYLSPFRFDVKRSECTSCMKCIPACNYAAMNRDSQGKLVIGNGCTYCGDCLTACPHNALEYRFFGMRGDSAERLWIVVTIILHTLFLAIARV